MEKGSIDMAQKTIQVLEEIKRDFQTTDYSQKAYLNYIPKKNAQIHLHLESEFYDNLKRLAVEKGMTLSEYCRRKLRANSRSDILDSMVKHLVQEYITGFICK